MNNKKKYKRAFSTLHTSEHFEFNLEDGKMIRKTFKMRKVITVLCFALVLTVGGVSVYAANVGGIQRIIQVWIQGDRTDATLIVNEKEGTYLVLSILPESHLVLLTFHTPTQVVHLE